MPLHILIKAILAVICLFSLSSCYTGTAHYGGGAVSNALSSRDHPSARQCLSCMDFGILS
jgi:hypothetical protein